VHTTVPVHEVHHEATHHHGTTTPLAMSIDEVKHKGGVLGGKDRVYTENNGCPPGVYEGTEGRGLRRTPPPPAPFIVVVHSDCRCPNYILVDQTSGIHVRLISQGHGLCSLKGT